MTKINYAIMAAVPFFLAACGGSGTATTTEASLEAVLAQSASSTPVTLAELQREDRAFTEEFGELIEPGGNPANAEFFDPADFPASGTALYDGFIGIGEDVGDGRDGDNSVSDAEIAGRVSFAIGLDSNIVVGLATGFIENDSGDRLDGTLNIDGSLNRSNPNNFGIRGNIDGALTHSDGRVSTVAGDEVVADLLGNNAGALSGDGEGTLTTRRADGTVIGSESYDFDLDIIATRR